MKFSFPLMLLGAVMFGYGYYLGRIKGHETSQAQADEIHASINKFIESSRALREASDKLRATVTDKPSEPIVPSPAPLRPGDMDKALKDGRVALYTGKEGNC